MHRARDAARRRARAGRRRDGAQSRSRWSRSPSRYPITPKEHGTDFLMDHRHLWLRSPRQQAILRIRAEVIARVPRRHGRARASCWSTRRSSRRRPARAPPRCSRPTTSTQKAYLTQSGQLYMEAAAMALGRVYCFGPAFRAEKSKTRRHLIEFWMMEPEWAFATLDDVIALEERLLVATVARVLEPLRRGAQVIERDAATLERRAGAVPAHPLQRRGRAAARGRACRSSGAATSAAPDETVLSQQFDRPAVRHQLPGRGEGVLHGARSGRSAALACRATAWRPRATARSSAAASAWRRSSC